MRVALLANSLRGNNGWSRYALDLGQALARSGHEVLAVVSEPSGAQWCEEWQGLARPIRYLEFPLLASVDAMRLRRKLNAWKPDVVHATTEPYALLLPTLRGAARASCATMHGSYAVLPFEGKASTRRRMTAAYRKTDRIFSVSAFTKGFLRDRHPDIYETLDLQEKIRVFSNSIDLTGVPPPIPRPPNTGIRRIIGVGAVKERKGYLEAVDACAALRATGMELRYDIIGPAEDPAYVAKLRERIARNGLQDAVILRGEISETELQRAYAEADLFLLLSLRSGPYVEGFGLVFLEANARGVPVIGPSTGGCPEAIHEGMSGFHCDPHDVESIVRRMEDILVRRMIDPQKCRAWAEEHESGKAAEAMAEQYHEMMGN